MKGGIYIASDRGGVAYDRDNNNKRAGLNIIYYALRESLINL